MTICNENRTLSIRDNDLEMRDNNRMRRPLLAFLIPIFSLGLISLTYIPARLGAIQEASRIKLEYSGLVAIMARLQEVVE